MSRPGPPPARPPARPGSVRPLRSAPRGPIRSGRRRRPPAAPSAPPADGAGAAPPARVAMDAPAAARDAAAHGDDVKVASTSPRRPRWRRRRGAGPGGPW